jgi:hypothetical protein
MSAPVVTTYVRYLYPGAFFAEDSAQEVSGRDPERIAREAPEGVFAFEFYDVVTATVCIGGEDVELRSKAIHSTGRYYIDAEALDAAGVEALPGDHSILLSNMRGNRWATILLCRTGNFQPLEDGDVLVSSSGAS